MVGIPGEEWGRLGGQCLSSRNPRGDGDGERGADIHQITLGWV